jgi:hypothetical protein
MPLLRRLSPPAHSLALILVSAHVASIVDIPEVALCVRVPLPRRLEKQSQGLTMVLVKAPAIPVHLPQSVLRRSIALVCLGLQSSLVQRKPGQLPCFGPVLLHAFAVPEAVCEQAVATAWPRSAAALKSSTNNPSAYDPCLRSMASASSNWACETASVFCMWGLKGSVPVVVFIA